MRLIIPRPVRKEKRKNNNVHRTHHRESICPSCRSVELGEKRKIKIVLKCFRMHIEHQKECSVRINSLSKRMVYAWNILLICLTNWKLRINFELRGASQLPSAAQEYYSDCVPGNYYTTAPKPHSPACHLIFAFCEYDLLKRTYFSTYNNALKLLVGITRQTAVGIDSRVQSREKLAVLAANTTQLLCFLYLPLIWA